MQLFYKNQGGTDFSKSRKEGVCFNVVHAHHTFQTAVNRQSGKACPRHGNRFLGPVPDSATLNNTFCKKGTIVIYLYWFETMCVRTLCKLQRNKQGWSPYHLLALFLKYPDSSPWQKLLEPQHRYECFTKPSKDQALWSKGFQLTLCKVRARYWCYSKKHKPNSWNQAMLCK